MLPPASTLLARPPWRHATVCRVLLRPCTKIHSHSSEGGGQPEQAQTPATPSSAPSPSDAKPRRKASPGLASSLAELQRRQQAQETTGSRMPPLDPASVLPRFQPGVAAGRVPQPGVQPKMSQAAPGKSAVGARQSAAPGKGSRAGTQGAAGVAGRSVQQVMPGAKTAQAGTTGERRRPMSTTSSVPVPQNGDTVTGRVVAVRDDYALVELFGLGRGMTGILEQPHVTKASNAPVMKSVLRPGMDVKALVINAAQRIISLSTAQLESSPGALANDPAAFFANADAVWLREFQSKGGTIIAPGKLPPPDTSFTDRGEVSTSSSSAPSTSSSAPAAEASYAPPSPLAPAPQNVDNKTSAPKLKPRGRGSLFGKKRTTATTSAPPPPSTTAATSGKNSDRLLQWKAVEDLCTSPQANRSAIMEAVKTMTKLLSGYVSAAPGEEKSGILSAVNQWVGVAKAHIATFSPSELAAVAAIWVLLEQKSVTSVQDQSMGPVTDKLPLEMVSFLTQLAINAQAHLRTISAHDLACVLGAAGVSIPGKVSVEWLMEAEIASFASLASWSGENLATVIYSLEQLGTPLKWAPNQTWLDAWLNASEPKLVTMGPRALSRSIKGLSGFKYKPSDAWIMNFNMSYQTRIQDMAPQDMANTLIGMAQLGIGGMGGQPGDRDSSPGGFGFDPNMPFPDFDEDMFNDFADGAAPDMLGKDGASMFDMLDKSGLNPEDMFGKDGDKMFEMMREQGMNPNDMFGEDGGKMFDMMREQGMNPEDMFSEDGGKMFDMMRKQGMNPNDMFGDGGADMMSDMMRGAGMNPNDLFRDDDDNDKDDVLDADFIEAATGNKPPSNMSPARAAGKSSRGMERGGGEITQTAEFSDLPADPQPSSQPPTKPAAS